MSNPTLREKLFYGSSYSLRGGKTMSLTSTINKAGLLMVALIVTAGLTMGNFISVNLVGLIACVIIGFIIAMITNFNPPIARYTAFPYAILEGVVLGGISSMYEVKFPGIVSNALFITLGITILMGALYQLKILRATENFVKGIITATGAICLVYIVDLVLSMFGYNVPYIHEGKPMWVSILVSLGIVCVAAFNLIIDFDMIEKGDGRAEKYMEWYAAFSLMVTVIWLYLEVLRLLGKIKK
jgi:uncharacterized YccA/Bax inhibitor family protein